MTLLQTKRNEDAPFYFEKLVAALDFVELLDSGTSIARLQIKPDRKYGPDRRIDDLTRFNKDKSTEVIQIKHTLVTDSKLGLSDLWTVRSISPKKEGTNIFKFLKSWRALRKSGCKVVILTLLSNKELNAGAKKFFSAVEKLKVKKLVWGDFSKEFNTELTSIKNNCATAPFKNTRELRDFICSLNYRKVGDIEALQASLEAKLKTQGITEKMKVDAFINRVTKTFVSTTVDVLQADVAVLIGRVKTGLSQEIVIPTNYIPRPALEKKILDAIDTKKNDGGFVLLFSPSGSGKTILLSRLAERNPEFFPYFCRIRPFETVRGKSGYSNKKRLSSEWFKADIIQRCNEFGLITTNVGITDDTNYIDRVFDESLTAISKKALERTDKKIVIIIDALDQVETDRYSGKSILDAIPPVQYPGVVFLLSTWGEKYLPAAIKNLSEVSKKDSGIDLYFTEEEIREYFKKINISLTQDQVAIIKSKTKGLAISLFYLAKKLRQGSGTDATINSAGQYDRVFEWYKPIWASLNADQRECLGCLCFHFARVKTDDLRNTVRARMTPAVFGKLLEEISPFIDTSGGYMEPYHDSFRRFVVSNLAGNKSHYHKKLAQYYSNTKRQSQYGIKYITRHLESAGVHNSTVKKIFTRLDREDFFTKVLRSKLDDPTKVEIGRSFASFFFRTKNVKALVKYAILSSNIYPTIYSDSTYQKAFIGTEKFIAEVEKELLAPKGSHAHDQREWVFRRLSVGNLLRKKADKNSLSIASRFLDDALFRLNLNQELLWDENAKQEFWHHVDIINEAYVNTGQYHRAIHFLKRGIKFTKPSRRTAGFIGSRVVRVHLQNLPIDRKKTLKQIAKSSKVERLLFYMALWVRREKVTSAGDFKSIMNDTNIESYLSGGKDEHQLLDFAEVLFAFGKKKYASRIKKILEKTKVDAPHYSHGYAYWGDMTGSGREMFLDSITMRTCIDSNFNFKEYYDSAIKEQFKNRTDLSEYDNPGFIETLVSNIELRRARLFMRLGQLAWKDYWKILKSALDTYKQKIDALKSATDIYRSDMQKTHSSYAYDLSNLIDENLTFISSHIPGKLEFAIGKVEEVLEPGYIGKHTNLMEIFVRIADISNPRLKDKVDRYIAALLKYKKQESLDNMTKSSNFQDLAMLTANKQYFELAEDIFEQSLKYSRGLWSKEDLRFYNFVDAVRTQDKKQLDFVAKCIEKVSEVVEGGWHWRAELLESATFANYELALDYAHRYIATGETNQNDSLRKIIVTYVKFQPYRSIGNILPLAALIDFKDENGHDSYENISSVSYTLIKAALKNDDIQNARLWAVEYLESTKRDLSPDSRINVLRDFISFAAPYSELKNEVQSYEKYIDYLLSIGYTPAHKSSSRFEPNYDGVDMKKLLAAAKKDQVEKIIKIIDTYVKKPSYFVDNLVVETIPYLSTSSIEQIRSWAKSHKVDLETSSFYVALIKKATVGNNFIFMKKVIKDIYKFQATAENFRSSRFIEELNSIEFPGKRQLIRRLLLVSLCKYAGDNYSLPSLFAYSSDAIDDNFLELKELSYSEWKGVVEKSMRLSLSK